MRQWQRRLTFVFLVAVMLLAVGRLGAQEEETLPDYPSFAEICREVEERSAGNSGGAAGAGAHDGLRYGAGVRRVGLPRQAAMAVANWHYNR